MNRKAPTVTRSAAIATASTTSLAITLAVTLAAIRRAAAAAATSLVIALAIAVTPNHSALAAEPYIDWTPAPITAKPGQSPGYLQFQMACSVCHGTGPGKPGTSALAAKYKGATPALLEERTDLNAAYIKQVVRHGLYVMPFFRKTELSETDLNAIVTYLTRKRP